MATQSLKALLPFAFTLNFLLAISVCLVAQNAEAQEEDSKSEFGELPPAREVMDRYIEALGGYEVLESIQTMHSISKGYSESGNFTYEIYRGVGKSRSKYVYESGSTTERGFADGVAWEILSGGAIRSMTGEELADFELKNKYPLRAPYWSEQFKKIELDGIERAGGSECYKIKLTRDNGDETIKHFDIESGLLIRNESKESFSSTTHQVIREFEDYRTVGETKIAHKQTIRFADSVFVFNSELEEYDQHIPAGTFVLPPAMALIAKQKKAEAKARAANEDAASELETKSKTDATETAAAENDQAESQRKR
ncbi:MAG: hypothetical protein AB8B55_06805 [Mariniblastus sp.]